MSILNIPPLVADKISPHAKELLKKVRAPNPQEPPLHC
jgi:hypothetical protein